MRTKKMTTEGFKNKKMNDSVYEQRRIVINMIYKAKRFLRFALRIEIPRVDVRIATREHGVTFVGKARMNDNIIWMPDDYLNSKHTYQVVLHELCHALWGVEHDENCKLMHPNVQPDLTNGEAETLFMEYAKKHAKV